MADTVPVTSCPLCLDTDEISAMVVVSIQNVAVRSPVKVVLCRRCVGAIAEAWANLDPADKPAPGGAGEQQAKP